MHADVDAAADEWADPLMGDKHLEELLNGQDDGLWALQDDLMLEEAP